MNYSETQFGEVYYCPVSGHKTNYYLFKRGEGNASSFIMSNNSSFHSAGAFSFADGRIRKATQEETEYFNTCENMGLNPLSSQITSSFLIFN